MWEYEGNILDAILDIVDFSIFDEDEVVSLCKQFSQLGLTHKIIIYEIR